MQKFRIIPNYDKYSNFFGFKEPSIEGEREEYIDYIKEIEDRINKVAQNQTSNSKKVVSLENVYKPKNKQDLGKLPDLVDTNQLFYYTPNNFFSNASQEMDDLLKSISREAGSKILFTPAQFYLQQGLIRLPNGHLSEVGGDIGYLTNRAIRTVMESVEEDDIAIVNLGGIERYLSREISKTNGLLGLAV